MNRYEQLSREDLFLLILREVGLEVDSSNNRIKDQDNGNYLKIGNRFLKISVQNELTDIELDPYNDRVMSDIFTYYCHKIEMDNEFPITINHFADYNDKKLIYLGVSIEHSISKEKYYFETSRYEWEYRAIRYIEGLVLLNSNIDNLIY